jgi:DNA-binding NtrC family response regulator
MSNQTGRSSSQRHPQSVLPIPETAAISELGFERWLERYFLGDHALIRAVRRSIVEAAAGDWPVLITGETGTGKDMVAQAIHAGSPRSPRDPHVVVVTSLGDTAWSILFGHRKGAYSGADHDHEGLFRQADGSTLILEDVSDVPLKIQPMLLRAVEHGVFRPLGRDKEERVSVRIISTTNAPLAQEVASRKFRADLYQRLSAYHITLPPLRSHPEDLDVLAPHLLSGASGTGLPPRGITPSALAALKNYPWPGNVRELENVLLRARVIFSGKIIEAEGVERLLGEETFRGRQVVRRAGRPPREIGREDLLRTLEEARGNKREAARRLGVSPATMYALLRRHHVEAGRFLERLERN